MDYDHVKKQLGYGIQTESKDNAIKAIEQLTARVRELEEENARLRDAVRQQESQVLREQATSLDIYQQLAASQLHAEQLREAINKQIPDRVVEQLWQSVGVSTYHPHGDQANKLHHFATNLIEEFRCRLPLALPHDTSALDAYVAEKLSGISEQLKLVIRQRDLAVDALRKCRYRSLVDKVVDDALEALSTIKESEAMAQGEKK